MVSELPSSPVGYAEFLTDLKSRLGAARLRAALSVNRELVLLYWDIGKGILDRQGREGWGAKVIERLSQDLHKDFPEMKGLSPRNLKYMRAFAEAYPARPFVQELLAQITWYHNIALLEQLDSLSERTWYAHATIEHGWSRNVLVHQIESEAHKRSGAALTNFKATLPASQSDLAQQIIKDPYSFDFLSLAKDAKERELQKGLLIHLRDFLLELGKGFAFVGNEVRLAVGKQDYFLDLLFYHLKLHCYVVIELKMGEFKPEFAGKMNFYLSAVDSQMRSKEDNPTIGIILCKSRENLVVEYALRDAKKPIGVAAYHLTKNLPEKLKKTLPTTKQIEKELEGAS